MQRNYRQIKAIEAANKKRILAICPNCPETSGIYFFVREENGIRYAYIGKAKHLLTRAAQHLTGYQRIDISIKKHGLWSVENPTGYEVNFLQFPESELDEKERQFIGAFKAAGFEMRNIESGGTLGKTDIGERKPARGYHDGLRQGYKNARREVAHWFDLHLDFVAKKNPPTKNQLKAIEKFKEFINLEDMEV